MLGVVRDSGRGIPYPSRKERLGSECSQQRKKVGSVTGSIRAREPGKSPLQAPVERMRRRGLREKIPSEPVAAGARTGIDVTPDKQSHNNFLEGEGSDNMDLDSDDCVTMSELLQKSGTENSSSKSTDSKRQASLSITEQQRNFLFEVVRAEKEQLEGRHFKLEPLVIMDFDLIPESHDINPVADQNPAKELHHRGATRECMLQEEQECTVEGHSRIHPKEVKQKQGV